MKRRQNQLFSTCVKREVIAFSGALSLYMVLRKSTCFRFRVLWNLFLTASKMDEGLLFQVLSEAFASVVEKGVYTVAEPPGLTPCLNG